MCYGYDEDIKSHFLTSSKPKNAKKQVKIMHITSLKWRSKMSKNCIFVDFFSKPIKKLTPALAKYKFCLKKICFSVCLKTTESIECLVPKINVIIWKFEKLSNFPKKSKFSFFLLLIAMCYSHDEDIKSYFLTSGKPKKQTKSQNNAYNILEMKLKNDYKLHFCWFFSQAKSQNWHKHL